MRADLRSSACTETFSYTLLMSLKPRDLTKQLQNPDLDTPLNALYLFGELLAPRLRVLKSRLDMLGELRAHLRPLDVDKRDVKRTVCLTLPIPSANTAFAATRTATAIQTYLKLLASAVARAPWS